VSVEHSEPCGRCGVLGKDRRTLWMACLYKLSELGIPFEQVALHSVLLKKEGEDSTWGWPIFEEPPDQWDKRAQSRAFYTLRVCKGCRGAWMDAIQQWFRAPIDGIARYNNDCSDRFPDDNLPQLIADLEAKTRELEGLKQRLEYALANGRAELDRRQHERLNRLPDEDS